jgi:hypothetical protein
MSPSTYSMLPVRELECVVCRRGVLVPPTASSTGATRKPCQPGMARLPSLYCTWPCFPGSGASFPSWSFGST